MSQNGDVAEDFDLRYAVVDKNKDCSAPYTPLNPLVLDSSVYAVVNETKISRATPKKTPQYEENVISNTDMSESVENALYDNNSALMNSVLDRSVSRAKCPERSHPKKQPNSALCFTGRESKNNELPKTKKFGIMLIALLVAVALFMAAGVSVIVAVVLQISKLNAEVALLQSTSLMESTTADPVNITRLAESVQALETTIDTRFGIELDVLNDRLSTNISNLALSLHSTIAANWTRLDNELNNRLDNISEHISIQHSLINQIISQASLAGILVGILNETGYAFGSCAAIQQFLPSSLSGYYHIRSSNGLTVRVYCDMTRACGNITGGWMRVAELDMTDNNTQCPSSLELLTSPRRTCRTKDSSSGHCSSDTFTVAGVEYSKVCGRITAYQVGSPDAYRQSANIDTYYVDGVSLTHGTSPRQHIWTFAAALNEDDQKPNYKCSCINTAISSMVSPPPSFVGEDYFCDTAAIRDATKIFYADDPLWDGAGCGPQNTCRSFNTPPWFYKQLPQTTTDDIEMRVCRNQGRYDEVIAIKVVEVYVQ